MIPGFNYKKRLKETTQARPSGNGAKFVKFGQEIDVQEFINEGRAGTEINEIVKNAGGLDKLKAFNDNTVQNEKIDMSIDFTQANKILKIAQIKEKKLLHEIEVQKAIKEAEAMAKAEAMEKAQKTVEAKGEVNA